MSGKYDDIINLPHHVSKSRPQMSIASRAAQFSPFAALTGYEDAVVETARLTDSKIELDETMICVINDRLNVIKACIGDGSQVSITHFVKDKRKSGGQYVTTNSHVRKIDEYSRIVLIWDGTRINIADIYSIEGDMFEF